MCGRFVAVDTQAELMAEFFVGHLVGPDVPPSWNVAPTMPVRIVLERLSGPGDAPTVRELRTVSWGLIPHWATDPSIGARMINARSETVAVKPAFRAAAVRRRCIVPANGYYEWMASSAGPKTPFYLHHADGAPLAMAGLYESWRDPELPNDDPASVRWTCTIITRAAPDSLGHIHDRSPVLVPPDLWGDWLDCSAATAQSASTVQQLLAGMPPPQLVPRQVSRAVGNIRNDSPALIEPAGPETGPAALF